MSLGSEYWLKVNKGDEFGENLVIHGSGLAPFTSRANGSEFRVAVFSDKGDTPADLSDQSTLSLSYMPVSRTDTAIASKTVSITNSSFTKEQWEAGTHYHALFVFTDVDLNPTLDSALSKEFWMVCHGVKSSDSAKSTMGAGTFTLHEDGTANAVSAPDIPGTGITAAQAQALIDANLIDNVFTITDDGDATKEIAFQASGITTGTTRTITMPDADVDLGNIGNTTEFADDEFRIQDDGDATKEIAFQASGITTGTTRTITMPDADVDLGNITAATEFADDTFRVQDDGDATKEIAFQASGITTGTTRTITMPDADVDLGNVGDAEFSDTTFRVQDDGDATKEIAFQASGITTGTTRTITMPDADVDLGDVGDAEFSDTTFRVQDDGDATKEIAFQASGITTGTTRTITMPDSDVDLGNILGSSIQELLGLNFTDAASVTIASGSIAYTQSYMEVETQGGASQDDLDNITGGAEGDIFLLKAKTTGHDITVGSGGNIVINGSTSLDLLSSDEYILLINDGTNWIVLLTNADIFATQSQVDAGTVDNKAVTPKTLEDKPQKIYNEKHSASHTISAAECYGGVHYVTSAATITLPLAVDGMHVTVITIGDIAVSVDPNAIDKIYLDGTALDDGDKITNLSSSGDLAVLTYYDSDGWYAATNLWTDGGA